MDEKKRKAWDARQTVKVEPELYWLDDEGVLRTLNGSVAVGTVKPLEGDGVTGNAPLAGSEQKLTAESVEQPE